MPKLTNPHHEAFALAAAAGARLDEASEDAGLGGGVAQARRLAGGRDVAARIAELRQEQADLDEARPTAVIIALVWMAREAERLRTVAGMREARQALLQAHRLHAQQTRQRHDVRLTVLDDDEWDSVFRTVASQAADGAPRRTPPAMGGH